MYKQEAKPSYGVMAPCNAPFNNMYFTVQGFASPCWKLPGFVDSWSSFRSISDIWFGKEFGRYRDALKQNIFLNACKDCEKNIKDGVWPLAAAYEEYPVAKYPSLIELELSNQCNLECVMCSGELSSGIRKNREKKPPLRQVYDSTFVDQLREFVPHLTELRFNGGEPFAQKIVLDICDMVLEVNPNLKINFATNGTVYSKRVKKILEQNNAHINLSIDSLDPQRYSEIRINGKLEDVHTNFARYKKYCGTEKSLCIMVNPMRNNWFEMVDFLKFTDTHEVFLWYNTIMYPEEWAIWNLPAAKIEEIYRELRRQLIDYGKHRPYTMYHITEHLIEHQIKNWWKEALVRESSDSQQ
jgi:MoaA/NifB/PqqE/SkfB family radical SAM enzyme